jgi:tripartite-type tricarboxylate transporter receptor subunit TctC
MLSRRDFVRSLALAPFVGAESGAAATADWPQQPVRIIYPYAAGSANDIAARLIASCLSDTFGQPFIVENRTGANGVIASEAVARSQGDGYTLLCALTPQIAISPATTKVSYDAIGDFVPISEISTYTFALVVNAKIPVKTVGDFVDYVRTQSNGFAYATTTGSVGHLAMALFLDRAQLRGTNVSYKGNQPALLDVVAGHLPAMFSLFGDALSQAQSGAIRLVAVSSERRSVQAPDIPTIAESGFPGFRVTSWSGLMAPKGTPQSVVDRIAARVSLATKDPQIKAQFLKHGIEPVGSNPTEFAETISADIKQWAKAVQIAGLQPR